MPKHIPAFVRCSVVLLFSVLLMGCDTRVGNAANQVLMAIGVTDPPSSTPLLLDLIVDTTPGSPGKSPAALAQMLAVTLPEVAKRHGVVRVWILESVEEMQVVAEVRATGPVKHGSAAAEEYERTWPAATQKVLLQNLADTNRQVPRTSPIAAGLSKVGLSGISGHERLIVVISDLREESGIAHTECEELLTSEAFLESLHANGALLPNSFAGVRVAFTFFDVSAVQGNRCKQGLPRYQALKELWQQAMARTGAQVSFHMQVPIIDDLKGGTR